MSTEAAEGEVEGWRTAGGAAGRRGVSPVRVREGKDRGKHCPWGAAHRRARHASGPAASCATRRDVRTAMYVVLRCVARERTIYDRQVARQAVAGMDEDNVEEPEHGRAAVLDLHDLVAAHVLRAIRRRSHRSGDNANVASLNMVAETAWLRLGAGAWKASVDSSRARATTTDFIISDCDAMGAN